MSLPVDVVPIEVIDHEPPDLVRAEVMGKETDGEVEEDMEKGFNLIFDEDLLGRVVERMGGHELPRSLFMDGQYEDIRKLLFELTVRSG